MNLVNVGSIVEVVVDMNVRKCRPPGPRRLQSVDLVGNMVRYPSLRPCKLDTSEEIRKLLGTNLRAVRELYDQ